MATPKETLWEMEPHTLAKHEILRLYLRAWVPILGQSIPRWNYVDGFCGPGRYTGGEDGSPVIALKTAIEQTARIQGCSPYFWFIDHRQDRIDYLQDILKKVECPVSFRVHVEQGEFHRVFNLNAPPMLLENKRVAPTFSFVDPFGFGGIPYALISEILSNKSCEVFINFSVEFINRFLEHPNDKTVNHIVEAMGTDECLTLAKSGENRIESLRRLYQKQLEKVARFVRHFEMRGSRNEIVYYMFFASNNSLGHIKMKEAMYVAGNENFVFSDKNDPNQDYLFDVDHTDTVCRMILERFGTEKGVRIGKILEFIQDSTPFLKKHMNKALELLDQQGKLRVLDRLASGDTRRKGTFPDGAVVNFGECSARQFELFE